ncbi:type IV secretion protein DotU [Vibrio sp. SM6]|uniref:Type IV secretion protein DotU n=2 Tax=Vibrio agarilyticus TaxID=2726741 RepID=A0A7X8YFW5_9VIBR|nr:type IV secretion protein DotU [Vibrio agarilyticus]
MDPLLDDVTIAIHRETHQASSSANETVCLSQWNALKNQARYQLFQQHNRLFDNQILQVSAELLSLVVTIKRLACPQDIHVFRSAIKGMLTDLKYKVAKLDYPPSVADKTCFLFAVMLDEQILHSSWGENAGWENHTLVSELFGIKNGGEQFYVVVERALLQPVLLADLLELIYMMLKLGFRGQYRVDGKALFDVLMARIEDVVLSGSEQSQAYALPTITVTESGHHARPQAPVRLWRGLFAAVVISVMGWAGVAYWYGMTLPTKARPFTQLPDFTEQYYRQANVSDKEYIYISTAEEMVKTTPNERPPSFEPSAVFQEPLASEHSSTVLNAQTNFSDVVTNAPKQFLPWRVQLATLSSKASAQNFLSVHGAMLDNATVSRQGDFYIVTSDLATVEEARGVINMAKNAGINDAFIIKAKR